jgi:predicted MFS family arabinose efflux permease
MLMLSLAQAVFGVAAIAGALAASFFILRRDDRAPLAMVLGGAFGLVFFLTFNPLRFEMVAALLLLATGVVLMIPTNVSDVLDDIEVGESTATRRRR